MLGLRIGQVRSGAWLGLALACASCAPGGAPGGTAGNPAAQPLARRDQGNLQPQEVTGPCGVVKFIIDRFTATSTGMLVGNVGGACGFTIFNPDLQLTLNAAYVTGDPAHGRATAQLVSGNRQVAVSYQPEPGYLGHDSFSVTIEPDNWAFRVNVTVQAESPVPKAP